MPQSHHHSSHHEASSAVQRLDKELRDALEESLMKLDPKTLKESHHSESVHSGHHGRSSSSAHHGGHPHSTKPHHADIADIILDLAAGFEQSSHAGPEASSKTVSQSESHLETPSEREEMKRLLQALLGSTEQKFSLAQDTTPVDTSRQSFAEVTQAAASSLVKHIPSGEQSKDMAVIGMLKSFKFIDECFTEYQIDVRPHHTHCHIA